LETPVVSVVVPSYQSSGYIRSALAALTRQETALRHEIIVVDSSTDGTAGIVEREFAEVRLVRSETRLSVGAARNRGVEAARGRVVLFTDTDTIPCPTWMDQMARAILDGHAEAVCGTMRNGTPWSASGSVGFYLEFFRFVSRRRRPQPARFLVGGNCGYRRELLAGNPFEDASLSEDMIFSARLADGGARLLLLPGAAVRHQNRIGLRRVFAYQRHIGAAAFHYRSLVSAQWVRLLRKAPLAIFLAPFAVMGWIAGTLLARRCFADLARFLVLLPLCWAAGLAWALGFYRALRSRP
jgi:glycosyltransferase involved in cell wall biosynthesis